MKLRSILMTALKNHLTPSEMSQAQTAKLFGVTQPRTSNLMGGKINLFGLDVLGERGDGCWVADWNACARSCLTAAKPVINQPEREGAAYGRS